MPATATDQRSAITRNYPGHDYAPVPKGSGKKGVVTEDDVRRYVENFGKN